MIIYIIQNYICKSENITLWSFLRRFRRQALPRLFTFNWIPHLALLKGHPWLQKSWRFRQPSKYMWYWSKPSCFHCKKEKHNHLPNLTSPISSPHMSSSALNLDRNAYFDVMPTSRASSSLCSWDQTQRRKGVDSKTKLRRGIKQ